MLDEPLHGCRVLVVEDEYLLADELSISLMEVGADVLGPVGSVEVALNLMGVEGEIDAAVLDVNLAGETVFPVAEALSARAVPFVFASGYDQMPSRYAHVMRYEKPVDARLLIRAIGALVLG